MLCVCFEACCIIQQIAFNINVLDYISLRACEIGWEGGLLVDQQSKLI